MEKKHGVTFLIITLTFLGFVSGFLTGVVIETNNGSSLIDEVKQCQSMDGELSVWHNDSAKRYEAECIVSEKSTIIFEYWIND